MEVVVVVMGNAMAKMTEVPALGAWRKANLLFRSGKSEEIRNLMMGTCSPGR